jgi:hypothetical protein
VSCASATACTAVGYFDFGAGCVSADNPGPCTQLPLVEHWNGSRWSIQRAPAPRDARDVGLNDVSCTATTACTAVGGFTNSARQGGTFVVRSNGSRWSLQRITTPSGAKGVSLGGVSCTSARACTAVGNFTNRAGQQGTLAERWNGSRWSAQRIANPGGAKGVVLSGVSCASAALCTAVGTFTNSAGQQVTLAERWRHSRWSVQQTANVIVALPAGLNGVSCASRAACIALGSFFTSNPGGHPTGRMLAERRSGGVWSIQPTPNPAGSVDNQFGGVSCSSMTACTAVGNFDASAGISALAAQWNGTSWSIQQPANPSGATDTWLEGVSCASAGACTAVGTFAGPGTGNNSVTLAERWNGSSWSIEQTASAPGTAGSALTAVSCTSKTACIAVGAVYNQAGGNTPLAERWTGSSWTIQHTPKLPRSAGLYGVSCTSATACTAVGGYPLYGGYNAALVERWNGTSWTIQHTPKPKSATLTVLNGVSCTSATACTAVGGYAGARTDQQPTTPLAEAWNGTRWTIESTPNPTGSRKTMLNGVSCTSATICTAVGSFTFTPTVFPSDMPLMESTIGQSRIRGSEAPGRQAGP